MSKQPDDYVPYYTRMDFLSALDDVIEKLESKSV